MYRMLFVKPHITAKLIICRSKMACFVELVVVRYILLCRSTCCLALIYDDSTVVQLSARTKRYANYRNDIELCRPFDDSDKLFFCR